MANMSIFKHNRMKGKRPLDNLITTYYIQSSSILKGVKNVWKKQDFSTSKKDRKVSHLSLSFESFSKIDVTF